MTQQIDRESKRNVPRTIAVAFVCLVATGLAVASPAIGDSSGSGSNITACNGLINCQVTVSHTLLGMDASCGTLGCNFDHDCSITVQGASATGHGQCIAGLGVPKVDVMTCTTPALGGQCTGSSTNGFVRVALGSCVNFKVSGFARTPLGASPEVEHNLYGKSKLDGSGTVIGFSPFIC